MATQTEIKKTLLKAVTENLISCSMAETLGLNGFRIVCRTSATTDTPAAEHRTIKKDESGNIILDSDFRLLLLSWLHEIFKTGKTDGQQGSIAQNAFADYTLYVTPETLDAIEGLKD